MASSWLLHTIYAALIGQSTIPSNRPPSPDPTTTTVPAYRPILSTAYGDLQGIRTQSSSGVYVDEFLGIPYAAPPVGRLRLQKPLPSTKWAGVRDASKFGNECHQWYVYSRRYQVTDRPLPRSEDCLFLNVYKPVTALNSVSDRLPVMVWIHGGSYYLGAGSHYDGSELASNGVIVVTINYRLDIFGYLSNEDDVIPGNYGMLDQILALKWVKSNIQTLGGDASKVTVFGESTGSTSVSLLILSPLARGLFSRAIMESGTSLTPWAMHLPAHRVAPRQIVNRVAKTVNCDLPTAFEKLTCLRSVDAETLLNASLTVQNTLGAGMVLTPVVEKTFGFLPDLPSKMWKQGIFSHVDTVRGFNTAEDGESALYATRPYNKELFISSFKDYFFGSYNLADEDRLIAEMLQTYVGNDTNERNILMGYVYGASDIDFKGPALIESNMERKFAADRNHYVYEFDHRPSLTSNPIWLPATHAQEIEFVFGLSLKQFQESGKSHSMEDQIVGRQMQTLWTNFAKYGKPTQTIPNGAVQWNTYNPTTAMVLRIGASSHLLSYKNHTSVDIFPKVLQRMETAVTDDSIIG